MELVKGVNELTLLEETIEEIKGLKMHNDFNVFVNNRLLNPSIIIKEAFMDEEIVTEIIFDKYSQEFYIPSTKEMLSQSEVIQHIKRAFIPWITGEDYAPSEELQRLKLELLDSIEPHHMGRNVEFVKIVEEMVSMSDELTIKKLDQAIELYEADSDDEYFIILSKYGKYFKEMANSFDIKIKRLREIQSELQGKTGIISKLMGLFH